MVICVTNRTLCKDDFLKRVESICQAGPKFIILREKDLDRKEYTQLAAQCLAICKTYGIQLVLHTHIQSALDLGVTAIHLPLPILKQESKRLNAFTMIGTSVHAVEEVALAQNRRSYLPNGLQSGFKTSRHLFLSKGTKRITYSRLSHWRHT